MPAGMIRTARLDLLPLDGSRLRLLLEDPPALEHGWNVRVSRDVVTEPVVRAVRMKLEKMGRTDPALRDWLTYWALIIRAEAFAAGFLGFKGYPDAQGEAEIGYGIDPRFQNQGFMTEAVTALIHWAFAEKECRAVTAKGVRNANIGSQRVLEKAGFRLSDRTAESCSYRILRAEWESRIGN